MISEGCYLGMFPSFFPEYMYPDEWIIPVCLGRYQNDLGRFEIFRLPAHLGRWSDPEVLFKAFQIGTYVWYLRWPPRALNVAALPVPCLCRMDPFKVSRGHLGKVYQRAQNRAIRVIKQVFSGLSPGLHVLHPAHAGHSRALGESAVT